MSKGWLAFVLVLGLIIGPARAETIIVAATDNAGFAPGTRLAAGHAISVPEGARITLLSQSGAMQVIDGPFSGNPSSEGGETEAAPDAGWSAVLALVGDPDARSDVMGASRKTDGEFLVPPGIWHVSVDSSGPRCSAAGEVTLWRKDARTASDVSVRNGAGRLTDLNWAEGDQVLSLPASFAQPGRMIVSVGGELRDLELAVAPEHVATGSPGQVLAWLLDRKCQRQALTLIERVHAGLGVSD